MTPPKTREPFRREQHHETIVRNWLAMSDEALRLRFGELTAQDLRNMRALLNAMLSSQIIKP